MMLEGLIGQVEPAMTNPARLPPLETWTPPLSGDMALTIAADGRWYHEGRVMSRPRLVRLLSTILRREADGDYYLVSPVEKWRIQVEDRPLLIVDADREADAPGGGWRLTTNLGDTLVLGREHRLALSPMPGGDVIPEVPVRHGLAARLNRNVYYRLLDVAESRQVAGSEEWGLVSGGVWQPLGRLEPDA
ncbi:DUF1285 domain-containing protein [Modicisalibacter tunisiensis]|uniref:DUF1285 domain-containing protein n=1 Tax=Modicisalibacter tunisiensis TaxID=390637 RepID=A0ABS7X1B2_9GAMM|nr:DUF1285 domain-containing protein [Modicisalibacter tunisiensis]MBZ9537906.1 DUF1285 domain-containing protein [Modicisalibacter tunisiensis]MBZ9568677.1 DUF1285 domain-containing protein [Modicisalibacter tunisiensis]